MADTASVLLTRLREHASGEWPPSDVCRGFLNAFPLPAKAKWLRKVTLHDFGSAEDLGWLFAHGAYPLIATIARESDNGESLTRDLRWGLLNDAGLGRAEVVDRVLDALSENLVSWPACGIITTDLAYLCAFPRGVLSENDEVRWRVVTLVAEVMERHATRLTDYWRCAQLCQLGAAVDVQWFSPLLAKLVARFSNDSLSVLLFGLESIQPLLLEDPTMDHGVLIEQLLKALSRPLFSKNWSAYDRIRALLAELVGDGTLATAVMALRTQAGVQAMLPVVNLIGLWRRNTDEEYTLLDNLMLPFIAETAVEPKSRDSSPRDHGRDSKYSRLTDPPASRRVVMSLRLLNAFSAGRRLPDETPACWQSLLASRDESTCPFSMARYAVVYQLLAWRLYTEDEFTDIIEELLSSFPDPRAIDVRNFTLDALEAVQGAWSHSQHPDADVAFVDACRILVCQSVDMSLADAFLDVVIRVVETNPTDETITGHCLRAVKTFSEWAIDGPFMDTEESVILRRQHVLPCLGRLIVTAAPSLYTNLRGINVIQSIIGQANPQGEQIVALADALVAHVTNHRDVLLTDRDRDVISGLTQLCTTVVHRCGPRVSRWDPNPIPRTSSDNSYEDTSSLEPEDAAVRQQVAAGVLQVMALINGVSGVGVAPITHAEAVDELNLVVEMWNYVAPEHREWFVSAPSLDGFLTSLAEHLPALKSHQRSALWGLFYLIHTEKAVTSTFADLVELHFDEHRARTLVQMLHEPRLELEQRDLVYTICTEFPVAALAADVPVLLFAYIRSHVDYHDLGHRVGHAFRRRKEQSAAESDTERAAELDSRAGLMGQL